MVPLFILIYHYLVPESVIIKFKFDIYNIFFNRRFRWTNWELIYFSLKHFTKMLLARYHHKINELEHTLSKCLLCASVSENQFQFYDKSLRQKMIAHISIHVFIWNFIYRSSSFSGLYSLKKSRISSFVLPYREYSGSGSCNRRNDDE